ncbi:MAG: hypothetical protein ABII22_00695 [Candidatus Micrarchaeota archaeon]
MAGLFDKSEIAEYKEFKNKEFSFTYPLFKEYERENVFLASATHKIVFSSPNIDSFKKIEFEETTLPKMDVKRISQGLHDACGECMLVGYHEKIKTNPNGVKYAPMRVLGNIKDWSGYEFYKEHGWSVSIKVWTNNSKGFSSDAFFKKVIETFKFL